MNRKLEIHELLALSPDEVRRRSGENLVVCSSLDALHQQMAQDIADEIESRNAENKPTRLILPVGPTAQYPLLAQMIKNREISLAQCWFFFMDEYCDEDGQVLDTSHPLSFRKVAHELLLDQLPSSCGLDPERVYFPNASNIEQLPANIAGVGGIDTCYGGIGVHGHVAFNEPETGVADLPARKVRLNDFTVTINAVRSQVGSNLEGFPRYAYTLGMREILQARRIRLYCRNTHGLDSGKTILRLALLGTPGDDYPVTHIRNHPDYTIITDENTLASPLYLI